MLRRVGWILVALALFAAWSWWRTAPAPAGGSPAVAMPDTRTTPATASESLPVEVADALRRIRAGGPFHYRQDGGVFQNRERLLPQRPHGYYREYTVETPGSHDRGARRIVAGGRPPTEFFYTADHYRSFRRIDAEAEALP
jgi:ribonuclease T1